MSSLEIASRLLPIIASGWPWPIQPADYPAAVGMALDFADLLVAEEHLRRERRQAETVAKYVEGAPK